MLGLPILVVIAMVAVAFLLRHREKDARARFLKRAGFILMAVFSAFIGLFVLGETFSDPGGWEALGLVSLWAVPLAVGAIVAWRWPDIAVRLFEVLVAAVIGLSIWFALDPEEWRSFEDRNGPVRSIIVFALSAAIALLGLKRTRAAGAMLLVLGIVPIAISTMGSDLGFTSLALTSSPPVVTGILYLVSAAMVDRSAPPGSAEPGSEQRPEAA